MKRYIIAWIKALRLFSFTIAFVSCLLGIVLAYHFDNKVNILHAVMLLVAGILLQAGVNLVNDFFEFKQGKLDNKVASLNFFGQERSRLEWFIYFSGILCFAAVVPMGLYLVYKTGLALLWIGIIGFIGGYFYTGEPFNYKRRGMAFVFVFFLMGVLMIVGSYYAVSAKITMPVLLLSIPVSALVSLLLLSNELRDFEDDKRHGIRTLSIRIGYERAKVLFILTVIFTYLITIILFIAGYIPNLFLIALSVIGLIKPLRLINKPQEERRPLPPVTAAYHLIFGILYILTFIVKP